MEFVAYRARRLLLAAAQPFARNDRNGPDTDRDTGDRDRAPDCDERGRTQQRAGRDVQAFGFLDCHGAIFAPAVSGVQRPAE